MAAAGMSKPPPATARGWVGVRHLPLGYFGLTAAGCVLGEADYLLGRLSQSDGSSQEQNSRPGEKTARLCRVCATCLHTQEHTLDVYIARVLPP